MVATYLLILAVGVDKLHGALRALACLAGSYVLFQGLAGWGQAVAVGFAMAVKPGGQLCRPQLRAHIIPVFCRGGTKARA